MRVELILALDLYRREGRNPSRKSIAELSDLLRAIPIEPELGARPAFRNSSAVILKVSNSVALDPAAEAKSMSRGRRGGRKVWDEFSDD